MVERGQRMSLAAAKLHHQRKHRRRVLLHAAQPLNYHSRVFFQRSRENVPGKEFLGNAVVVGPFVRDHLLQVNRELIRIERPPLPHLVARHRDLVPGV